MSLLFLPKDPLCPTSSQYMSGCEYDSHSTVSLANQVVIVTGANTGIGKETAKALLGRGEEL